MARNRMVGMILFYMCSYPIAYVLPVFLFSYLGMTYTLGSVLLVHAVIALGTLLVVHAVLKLSNERMASSFLSVRKRNVVRAFTWAAALSTPIPVLWLSGSLFLGADTMLSAAKPSWTDPSISPPVLASAILSWTPAGVVAFMFWEAFPYEQMKDFPEQVKIPLIAVLWAGLYNTPLLTGKIDPFDIVFFGLLFTYAYHRTRNSTGIMMAYLLNENPLWWVVAASLGSSIGLAFTISLVLRALICSIPALWLMRTMSSERVG